MKRDSFEYCCEIARIDPGWCRELLKSILLLPEGVRRDITRTCINMIEYIEPLFPTREPRDETSSYMDMNYKIVIDEPAEVYSVNSSAASDNPKRGLKSHTDRQFRKTANKFRAK